MIDFSSVDLCHRRHKSRIASPNLKFGSRSFGYACGMEEIMSSSGNCKEPRLHLGHCVRKLDNVLKRNMQLVMSGQRADELTTMNGWIIGYLHMNSNRDIYQKDIEAEFSIGRSAVTTVIARMEDKGFIRRESAPHDARLKCLRLTAKGEEQFRLIDATIQWINEKQTEEIPPEELEQCLRTMKKIAHNAEQLNERVMGTDKSWIQEIEARKEWK